MTSLRSAPRRQHVVSQALLARWCSDGRLEVHNLAENKSWLSTTASVGYVRQLIRFMPQASEDRWAETESRLGIVFQALDDRTFLANPEAIALAKSCIALHFGRSMIVKTLWDRNVAARLAESRDPAHYESANLAAVFTYRYGRPPGSPEGSSPGGG